MKEKISILLWISLGVLAIRAGWIFWSRHEDAVKMQQAVEASRNTGELPSELRGNAVKVLNFYAKSAEVAAGERDLMCYGVANATKVSLTPAVEDVHPAVSRCFWVTPRETTKYTLTAEGADGAKDMASLEIRVRR